MGTEPPLYRNVVKKLWQNVKPQNDKSFVIKTKNGPITEMPNNFGLADYITGEEVFSKFMDLMSFWKIWQNTTFNLHYGFHQETAALYLDRVKTLIQYLGDLEQSKPHQFSMSSRIFSELVHYNEHNFSIKTLSCSHLFHK